MVLGIISVHKEERIAVVKINRPETLNALDEKMLRRLEDVMEELAEDDMVDIVLITGEGKAFVAGADIMGMKDLDAEGGLAWGNLGQRVFRKIERMQKPVIAAVNGFALGGGCELAMACDIRIASEKAKFGQPEVSLGVTPGYSGTQRLPRLVGIAKAKELIFTGDIITADEAERIGLVNKVVKHEDLIAEAKEIANRILKNAQKAVRYSKMAINNGIQTDIDNGIEIEASLFALSFATEDQKEGMSAFVEKRKPRFKGK